MLFFKMFYYFLLMSICLTMLIVMHQAEEPELPKDVLAPAEGPRENLVSVVVNSYQIGF